jgi:hypothetical protein
MSVASTDRIEKKIRLSASRARVWKALTDAQEFGAWFGVRLNGPFAAGAPLRGVIVPTAVDAEVAKAQEPYAGMPFEITVDRSGCSRSAGTRSPSSRASTTPASRPLSSSSPSRTRRTASC